MPLWFHGFIAAIVATMVFQIYRAMTVGKILDGLSEIDRESSPIYFAILKYGHIVGLVAMLIFWAWTTVVFPIK
jgi:hypothetical protein